MSGEVKPGTRMARAIFRSIAPPAGFADAPHLFAKIFYPAVYGGSDLEKNTGALPLEPRDGLYPVAILLPGINVSPEVYSWLAMDLAKAGFVTICYGWILEEMPGLIALTSGLDISALKPDVYGTRPSATALPSVIAELERLNSAGPLAGKLDLNRILLGGHSAGGSVALFNGNPEWFPGIKAVFSYAAHSKASTMLGYAEDTVLKIPDALPTLIMGGSEDGVIANSAFRYGDDGTGTPDPIGPLRRSFKEGLSSERGDCHLAIVQGGNHFSAAYPLDTGTGRPFLDRPMQRAHDDIRADLSALIVNFARAYVESDATAQAALHALLGDRHRISESHTR